MTVTKENKIIARIALEAFGGKSSVSKYWDEKKVSNIDILATFDRPYDGFTSYSTIGLSDYSIGYSVDDKPLRIEIVGACATTFKLFPNILSTCAFNIINTDLPISYGKIFKGIIKMYYPDSEMEHVIFTSPFLWEKLKTIDFPDKKVTWLLALPISTKEFLFAEKEGTEALEDLFEKKEIDIFDVRRNSIL
ncbi:suppressor of fused domain protein [Psychrobacillus psychrodurans]|uniref:Suppressor of fused domain protein n=1 Tax=Psychrobacillus psychrodurans TaxID=126157 RepID=A0A9X3LCV5_9BACI|nr:suppressor of fused domain protein [Psychrobacillus psychrodurans]MCZ8535482.1 suppressor of fused domain protein [Psychrobacillus psychrodurans]